MVSTVPEPGDRLSSSCLACGYSLFLTACHPADYPAAKKVIMLHMPLLLLRSPLPAPPPTVKVDVDGGV